MDLYQQIPMLGKKLSLQTNKKNHKYQCEDQILRLKPFLLKIVLL